MSQAKSLWARVKGRTPAGGSRHEANRVNGNRAGGFVGRLRLAFQELSESLAANSSVSRPEFLKVPAMAPRAQSAARRRG